MATHRISILPGTLTVCRLDKNDPVPAWALDAHFVSIARTVEELSIIAPAALVPAHLPHDTDWRCVKVEGPLDFTLYGVLASLISPLASEKISVLAIATYDTDYFLVKEGQVQQAALILRREGHEVLFQE